MATYNDANKRQIPYLYLIAIPLLLTALLPGCSGSDKKAGAGGMPALPVTVIEAKGTQVPITIEEVGQTEGAKEVEVRARVGGILLKQLYSEGAPVRAGQPMFQIDPAPFEIARAQAQAQLADQKAKLEQANREMNRLKGLISKQAVSQRDVDDATSNAAVALAGVQSAEASLRQAELNLAYTVVTAPVSGISGRAERSVGSLVSTGTDSLLTTLAQTNPIWVRFSLSDSDVAQLPGARLTSHTIKGVEMVLPDGSVYPEKGQINFASSVIAPKLGTLQLRAAFPNADDRILPGQFVRARLLIGQRQGVFLIPQTAVMQSERGYFVFVAGANNKVEVRPITVGQWQGTNWVILGGLKAGDKVIADNLLKLHPGAPVSPHPPGAQPAPPQPGKA